MCPRSGRALGKPSDDAVLYLNLICLFNSYKVVDGLKVALKKRNRVLAFELCLVLSALGTDSSFLVGHWLHFRQLHSCGFSV